MIKKIKVSKKQSTEGAPPSGAYASGLQRDRQNRNRNYATVAMPKQKPRSGTTHAGNLPHSHYPSCQLFQSNTTSHQQCRDGPAYLQRTDCRAPCFKRSVPAGRLKEDRPLSALTAPRAAVACAHLGECGYKQHLCWPFHLEPKMMPSLLKVNQPPNTTTHFITGAFFGGGGRGSFM